jgi:excisionase family DNA binding protein
MANEKYMTVRETSKFLKISVSMLNRLIRQNGIPSYKIGHRRLFDRCELIQWVRNQGDGYRLSSESQIDTIQCLLCSITGRQELSSGDTCEECCWYELCRNMIDEK